MAFTSKSSIRTREESTGKSAHQDFSKFCQGRLLKNIDDPRYLECLRKLVVEYV